MILKGEFLYCLREEKSYAGQYNEHQANFDNSYQSGSHRRVVLYALLPDCAFKIAHTSNGAVLSDAVRSVV